MKWWSQEERDLLAKLFPDTKTQDIALMLGRSYGTVAQQARRLGLRKSEAFKESGLSGRNNLILGSVKGARKGISAHNKGKQMTAEHRAKCEHTFYQKGHPPYRYNKYPEELRVAIHALGRLKKAIKQSRKKKQI